MVKIGSLIGAIITSIAIIFQFIIFSQVFETSRQYLVINNDGDITWLEMVNLMRPERFYVSIVITVYVGMILIIMGSIQPKIILYLIGSIVFVIGNVFSIISWFGGNFLADNKYKLGYLIISIGAVLYSIGLIKYRKYNRIAPISGVLVAILVVITYFFLGTNLSYTEQFATNPLDLERQINLHLMFMCITGFVFAVHGWIISFSKKTIEEETQDTQSVEEGSAFESYVDETKTVKLRGKKNAKGSAGQDVEFKF